MKTWIALYMKWIADLDFQEKLCQPIFLNCTGNLLNIYCNLVPHINHPSDTKKLRIAFPWYDKILWKDKTVDFILSLANVPAIIKISPHKMLNCAVVKMQIPSLAKII